MHTEILLHHWSDAVTEIFVVEWVDINGCESRWRVGIDNASYGSLSTKYPISSCSKKMNDYKISNLCGYRDLEIR